MTFTDYFKNVSVIALIVIVALLAFFDITQGLHFGTEFIGGTSIPLTLSQPANPSQMNQVITTLQTRLSTFGLKQITVQAISSTEVDVGIASVSQSEILGTIKIIQSQGIFQGIVNGRVAVNGSSIIQDSLPTSPLTPIMSGTNVSWSVPFYVTSTGAQHFAKIAFGQANKPLYLFLDRPVSAIVLLNSSLISSGSPLASSNASLIGALQNSTLLGNRTIPIKLLNPTANNWKILYPYFAGNSNRYKEVILENNTPANITQNLTALNYTLVTESKGNMTPIITSIGGIGNVSSVVTSWPAIGLLASPTLNPGVTNGNISQGYTISGAAPANMTPTQKQAYATQQETTIASILSGGSLPVQVIVGTPTVLQPTLGARFLQISVVALLLAVIAVAIVIVIRYRKLFLIAPILLTTLGEMFIILSIIGLVGTIDLAAIAGIIAVVGTGVDAQIIISDEVLRGAEAGTMKTRLDRAFYIVWADVALLVIAMLPLFFSTSLVSVIGFSESTIIGALLGAFITRPSYGAIISRHYANR